MKKTLLLTLVFVMALSTVGFAAEIKTSGLVGFASDNVLANPLATYQKYRLQFDVTADNNGARVRIEDSGSGYALKRAYWFTKTSVGKIVAGKQWDDFSAIGYSYGGDKLAASFDGIAFYPTLGEGMSAFGFYDFNKKKIGVEGKYAAPFATISGGYLKADADADATMAIGASVPVMPDQLSVYGQYGQTGSAKQEYLGAKFTVSETNLTAEYELDSKTMVFDVSKNIGGIDYEATYTKVDTAEGTLGVSATLNF